MKKICFIGAPSTGKSTLANALVNHLRDKGYRVELVKEFARDFVAVHGSIKDPFQELAITWGQKEREKMAQEKNPDFVVCDSSLILQPVYLDFLKINFLKDGVAEAKFAAAKEETWKAIKDDVKWYDFVFFLPQEFEPEDDGIRVYTESIPEISDKILDFLSVNSIKYCQVKGTVQERLSQALEFIFKKTDV